MRWYEYRTPEEYNEYPHAKLPYRAVWEGFKDNTTAHGIPHVKTSRGPLKSLFWTVVSLALLSSLLFNGYSLFKAYLKYPINVLVNMETKRELDFPAITVCNFNPLRNDLVDSSPTLSALLGANSDPLGDADAPDDGDVCDAVTAGNVNDAPAPGNGDDPAAPGNGDDPAAPGNVVDPAAPGNFGDTAAPGNVGDPAAPGNGDDPAAPGNVSDTAASGNGDDTASLGNVGDAPAPGNVGDASAPGNVDDTAAPGNVGDTAPPGNGDDAASPGNVNDTAAPGNVDDTAAPGNVGDTAPPGNGDDAASPGNVSDTAAPGNGDDAGAPGNVNDTAAPGNGDDPAAPGNVGDAAAPGDVGDTAAVGNVGDSATVGNVGDAAAAGNVDDVSPLGNVEDAPAPGNVGGAPAPGNVGDAAASGDVGDAAASGDVGDAAAPVDVGDTAPAPGNVGDTAPAPGDVGDAAASGDVGDSATVGNVGDAAAAGNVDDVSPLGNVEDAPAPGNVGGAPAPGNVGDAAASGDVGDAAASGDVGDAAAPVDVGDTAPAPGNVGDTAPAPGDVGDAAASGDVGDTAPVPGDVGGAPAMGNEGGAPVPGNGGGAPAPGNGGGAPVPGNNNPPNANFQLQQNLMTALANMGEQERQSFGHQLEDFILSCEYSGVDCNATSDYFVTTFNSVYGNCFTYNWGISLKNVEVSYRPGPMYGLKLVINVDQYMYRPDLANAAGVRVVVHPQQIMPFPEDEGISARPGQETYIGISKLSISRLGGKYGECENTNYATNDYNVFAEKYGCIYSQKACEKTCYQENVINTCNCSDPMYPNNGSAFGYQTVYGCNGTYGSSEYKCKSRVELQYGISNLTCPCSQPCKEETFATTVSASKWPSSRYKESLRAVVAESGTERSQYLADRFCDDYQDNLVKLVIYFQEFNYESIKETEAYLASTFVGDLGGILGLYIGFSIMTILEFVELFLDVLTLSIFKCCSRGDRNKTGPTTSGKERIAWE